MKDFLIGCAVAALMFSHAYGMELAGKGKISENIAVLDFEGKDITPSEASIFTDFLRTELVKTGTFNVVEKANMEKILREVAFQQTGVTSTEDAVSMGKILNVRKMITGSVARLDNTFYITANLVDVESARIDKSDTLLCAGKNEFPNIASDIAERFSGVVLFERMVSGKKILMVISPKLGMFSPLDASLKSNHASNFMYGVDLNLWHKRHGILLDYEQYDDDTEISTSQSTFLENRINEAYVGPTIEEKLTIQSFNAGYGYRFSSGRSSYFYAGAGAGRLWSKLNGEAFGTGSFYSYFLKCGFKYKRAGATFKYTYAPSNAEWGDINFHGVSLCVHYNFETAFNLF